MRDPYKTPETLVPALRQYQHNDCSGLLFAFDYDEILIIVKKLETEAADTQQALQDSNNEIHGLEMALQWEQNLREILTLENTRLKVQRDKLVGVMVKQAAELTKIIQHEDVTPAIDKLAHRVLMTLRQAALDEMEE